VTTATHALLRLGRIGVKVRARHDTEDAFIFPRLRRNRAQRAILVRSIPIPRACQIELATLAITPRYRTQLGRHRGRLRGTCPATFERPLLDRAIAHLSALSSLVVCSGSEPRLVRTPALRAKHQGQGLLRGARRCVLSTVCACVWSAGERRRRGDGRWARYGRSARLRGRSVVDCVEDVAASAADLDAMRRATPPIEPPSQTS
jgi:hypothetical protein